MKRRNLFFYEAPTNSSGGTPPANPPPAEPPKPPTESLITQDKLNSLLAEQKRSQKAKIDKLTTDLKKQSELNSTSEAERQALQSRIDELNQTVETEEESAKRKHSELTERLNSTTRKLSDEKDTWKKKFFDAEIGREIITVAEESGALHSNQIMDLILNKVNIDIDDKGVHSFKIGTGEEAKNIKDYIKSMVEDVDNYGNLFKTQKTPGQGGDNKPGDVNTYADMSVEQIIEARRKKNAI